MSILHQGKYGFTMVGIAYTVLHVHRYSTYNFTTCINEKYERKNRLKIDIGAKLLSVLKVQVYSTVVIFIILIIKFYFLHILRILDFAIDNN